MRKMRNPRIEATRQFCSRMVPLARAQILFLNTCAGLSRRRGGLGMRSSYPRRASTWSTGSPLFDGSGSPLLLRRRALPSSTGPFELTRLLLSRARGPASPIPASFGTPTTTRTTGVNMRNTGANSKGAGATAVAPMNGALAATAEVALFGHWQQQRQYEQPPPPSKAWCLLFPVRGALFANEQNLNAHSRSLHQTPVSSAIGPL